MAKKNPYTNIMSTPEPGHPAIKLIVLCVFLGVIVAGVFIYSYMTTPDQSLVGVIGNWNKHSGPTDAQREATMNQPTQTSNQSTTLTDAQRKSAMTKKVNSGVTSSTLTDAQRTTIMNGKVNSGQ
jgi:uncharacterized membrane protein